MSSPRVAVFALLTLAAFSASSPAQTRRRPVRRTSPPPSTAACQEAIRGALNGLGGALGGCVLHVHGFRQGQVRVRVTVDARGTLVSVDTSAQVNGAPDAAANTCVEAAVRAAHFTGCPTSAMTEAERTWSFQATGR